MASCRRALAILFAFFVLGLFAASTSTSAPRKRPLSRPRTRSEVAVSSSASSGSSEHASESSSDDSAPLRPRADRHERRPRPAASRRRRTAAGDDPVVPPDMPELATAVPRPRPRRPTASSSTSAAAAAAEEERALPLALSRLLDTEERALLGTVSHGVLREEAASEDVHTHESWGVLLEAPERLDALRLSFPTWSVGLRRSRL